MRTNLPAYSLSFCLAAAACLHAEIGHADPIGPLLPTTGGQIFKTYEIYRDGGDPNVHYALRTQPVLATAQNGGVIFSMEKFEGETAKFGGTITATISLQNNASDFDGVWAGKDIRSMPFVADPSDTTYAEIRDQAGNRQRMPLEATTDSQNRISFHIPLTSDQAERVWQTRTGNTLPVTLFLKRHVLAVTTDLKVNIKIDIHEIYKYFSANASVGFWVFKASYRQVRESHNIDNYIHVTTFQGEGVSGERLEEAQEEAWKRIKEILFRQTITPDPAPTPPTSGWPAAILAVANDFYNNFKLATGSGYLTADVIDIQKSFDAHYEYQIDQRRAQRRARDFYYNIDLSSLQNNLDRYFFLVQKFPETRKVTIGILPSLATSGAVNVKTSLWQEMPNGTPTGTQSLNFNVAGGRQPSPQVATLQPRQAQTLQFKVQTRVTTPTEEIKGAVQTYGAGEQEITAPGRSSDFYQERIVDFLTSGAPIAVKRADLAVTFQRKSDGTEMRNLVRADRINSAGARVLASSLDLTIWDCDDTKPMSYEMSAITTSGKFVTAGVPNVQARTMIQLRPTETAVLPATYGNLTKELSATSNPARQDMLLDQSLTATGPQLVFARE
jgi:hypothetical protein